MLEAKRLSRIIPGRTPRQDVRPGMVNSRTNDRAQPAYRARRYRPLRHRRSERRASAGFFGAFACEEKSGLHQTFGAHTPGGYFFFFFFFFYAETEVFSPCVVKARQIVAEGGVGKVLWVRSRESHGGPHSPHFWDSEKTGGGAMHDLWLSLHLCGTFVFRQGQ